jgi:hypothetical protein
MSLSSAMSNNKQIKKWRHQVPREHRLTFSNIHSALNNNLHSFVGFEVFAAVSMKNAVLWNVAPCGFIINRRFGGTCRFHLQSSKVTHEGKSGWQRPPKRLFIYTKSTRRHILEDDIKSQSTFLFTIQGCMSIYSFYTAPRHSNRIKLSYREEL